MSWVIKSHSNGLTVAAETVALGGTAATRYSSVIDFLPAGRDFVLISNTAATNTSGSLHDEVHIAYTSGGTKYALKTDLRASGQGTSYASLDTASRVRKWDVSADGEAPYMYIGLKHAAVESSSKTIGLAIIYNGKAKTIDEL